MVYLLAVVTGLFTIYSCDDDTDFAESNRTESSKVNIKDASIQEQAYADYLELLKSLDASATRNISSSTDFPEYYGGCYINEEGNLVVLIKEEKHEYAQRFLTRSLSSSIKYETCQYSYNELQQVVDEIRQKASAGNEFLFNNVSLYGISEKENSVEVGLLNNTPSVIQEFKKQICDSKTIKFCNSGKLILDSGIDCASEIKTHRDGKVHGASVGYRAKDKDGNIGIVTAGHFIKKDEILNDANDIPIGKCLYSKDENYIDAAFCSITTKDYVPTNRILYMEDVDKDTLSTTLAQPPAGSYVNMVGKSSKRSSGTIYNASYDVLNASQQTILKDVILARYSSDDGDSGGIVYALTKATNTRYTVGINLGRITIDGTVYGGCIKAYLINQTFGLARY